jgi:hypothetical protein
MHLYSRFFTVDKVDIAMLDKVTSKGNPYAHRVNEKYVENGHFIYLYICEPELRESWGNRSSFNFDGKTLDGGDVKQCLVRYLTSKGLRKDADGVDKLTNREIRYIESGKTNYIDTNKYALYPRIYISIWELYNYKLGANPSGYSISQRIEYLKTALHIIQKNFWFGVGTGDLPKAFEYQYEADKTPLAKEFQHRAHNQLVTFWVAFGFTGFMVILCALLLPPFFEKKYADYLFIAMFLICFLSFMDEDTLETHQGISFVAFFYALFLFYDKNEKAG